MDGDGADRAVEVVERIILEAKRLLAHSQLPVASISLQLGFDEETNFVKYFKRETGTTPNQLRAHLRSAERAAPPLPCVSAPR